MGLFTSSKKKDKERKKSFRRAAKKIKKYLRSRKRRESSSSSSMQLQAYKYQTFMNYHQPWGYRAPPVHSNWQFLRQEAPRVNPETNQTMAEYSKLLTEATQKVTESKAALEAALKLTETAHQ